MDNSPSTQDFCPNSESNLINSLTGIFPALQIFLDILNKSFKIDATEIMADLGESYAPGYSVRSGEPRPREVLGLQHGVEFSKCLADPVRRLRQGFDEALRPG
jgi:hypothetical protein